MPKTESMNKGSSYKKLNFEKTFKSLHAYNL